ncbi:MAG: methane monooxygenase/ammonia monooxygenase subunit A, partial [Methylobacter sp.]
QYAAPLAAFCSALLCILMYTLWWFIGKWFATVRYLNKI